MMLRAPARTSSCSSTSAKYPLGFRPLAFPGSPGLRELARVVVAEQIDFVSVLASQPPEVLQARLPLVIIVGPLRGQHGDRVVVGRQLDPQVVGVAGVQYPPVALPDRHPAVPERVAEERDEKDFVTEPKGYRSGLQPEPSPGRCRVRLPRGLVRELER